MGRQNTFMFAALVVSMIAGSSAHAQSKQYKRDKKAAPAPVVIQGGDQKDSLMPDKDKTAPSSEKIDVSGLEEKYWAAKDTDFSVVQNRTYTKANRVSLSVSGAMPVNDSFNSGTFTNFAVNYYFNERHGMELSYSDMSSLSDSKLVNTFISSFGLRPDMNREKSFYGVAYNFIPVYAKVSLLNSKIMYFDLSISPGIGMTNYRQFLQSGDASDSDIAYTFDISQQFFFTKNIVFRVDFKNRWCGEKIKKYYTSGGVAEGTVLRSDLQNTSYLLFGLTYFF